MLTTSHRSLIFQRNRWDRTGGAFRQNRLDKAFLRLSLGSLACLRVNNERESTAVCRISSCTTFTFSPFAIKSDECECRKVCQPQGPTTLVSLLCVGIPSARPIAVEAHVLTPGEGNAGSGSRLASLQLRSVRTEHPRGVACAEWRLRESPRTSLSTAGNGRGATRREFGSPARHGG